MKSVQELKPILVIFFVFIFRLKGAIFACISSMLDYDDGRTVFSTASEFFLGQSTFPFLQILPKILYCPISILDNHVNKKKS